MAGLNSIGASDHHAAENADGHKVFAEPTRAVGGWWIATSSLAWLGVWTAQLTPVQYLLPDQVADLFTTGSWQDSTLDFGIVAGAAAVCSVLAYPLTGTLSDRTTSRLGRRRPWIIAGTLLFAFSLLALSGQHTVVGITVFWSLASVGFCAISSGLTALISDQVPVRQRGLASAMVSAPQAIGVILGVSLVTVLVTGMSAGYAVIAVLLVVLVLPFLLVLKDERLPRELIPALTVSTFLSGFWVSPRRYPDFSWILLGRVLVNLGNALGTSLLLYFLRYGLDRPSADADLLVLTVIYAATSVLAAVLCGRMSDLLGRRRDFVIVSAGVQALAGVLLAVFPSYGMTIAGGALLGVGYGCFLAVDQALATEVLPDAQSRGKDLGIMNIASVLPQGVGPILGALVVTGFGSFRALFAATAIACLLGAVTVLPIRSVR
jgi:MFS family permease